MNKRNPILSSIRAIARTIIGQAVSDYDLTSLAQANGCDVAVTPDMRTLDQPERARLLEFVIATGVDLGYTAKELAGMIA